MHIVGPHVSCKRAPEVFIRWHIEIPAPTLAAAQLSSSMWVKVGGSHLLSMDINVFPVSAYFISAPMGSLKNMFLKNYTRIAVE